MKTANRDSVERFSNRVENYVKYRPTYPAEVLELFRAKMGLNVDSIVADIGSGTGISSRLFLQNGKVVYGVEPNAKMREAAEKYLSEFKNFVGLDGTAEATTIEAESVDFVIAAQAFHWFDPEGTRREFRRILKPGGWVALMWNERQLDTTPFLREYELLLLKFANDYTKVRHDKIDAESLKKFFQADFETATFANAQVLDFDGIRGRVSSSSYMPSKGEESYELMVGALRELFDKHAENDRITLHYDTNVFYTQY